MIKGMEHWNGNECDYETHERMINDIFKYMRSNEKASLYYTATGDTFVIGIREKESKCFEIFDCTIKRHGIFEYK